jgi:Tol biopolymer transport system component
VLQEPDHARTRRAAILLLLGLVTGSLAACGGSADDSPSRATTRAETPTPANAPRRAHPLRPESAPIALSSLPGHIAFSHGNDVWAAAADGSHAARLTSRPGPEFDPSWSPHGSRIVYRDSRRGINANDELYVMTSDGSQQRNLTRSPGNEWSPSWSPDGKLIAFYAGELYVIRPDGTRRHRITKVEGEYPAWSPDGKRLAFMSAEENAHGANPNYDVFVVNRDGTGLRQLTDWPGEDGWPSWSPDGKSIAFTTTHKVFRGGRAVWVMRTDGSGKHLVAFGEFPVWSPYGGVIMFSTSGGATGDHLRVVRPDGTGVRKLPIRGWLPDMH